MRYKTHVPMRWSDMDAYGHVNNTWFLMYLEEARVDMMHDLSRAAGEGDVLASGVLVAAHSIVYRTPLVHRSTPVPIDIWVTKIGGASFELGYEVHDDDGRVVYARASSRLVPYDFTTERPRRIQPFERAFLERYVEPDAKSPPLG